VLRSFARGWIAAASLLHQVERAALIGPTAESTSRSCSVREVLLLDQTGEGRSPALAMPAAGMPTLTGSSAGP
jgi:hypothetical protein